MQIATMLATEEANWSMVSTNQARENQRRRKNQEKKRTSGLIATMVVLT